MPISIADVAAPVSFALALALALGERVELGRLLGGGQVGRRLSRRRGRVVEGGALGEERQSHGIISGLGLVLEVAVSDLVPHVDPLADAIIIHVAHPVGRR
jgi:hypothetical protein